MSTIRLNHNKSSKKKRRLNVGAVVVSLVIIFLIFFIPISISNGGYKGVMKSYCRAITKQDYKLYKSVFPNFLTENGLESLMLFAYDTGDNYMQEMHNSYVDKYGKSFKASYKVIDRTKLSKDELAEYSEDATSLCTDGSEINIKKGYNLTVSMKYKGKSGSSTEELSVIVIKYDGKWYIYDSDIHFC
ncbi:MAG: hypothetical protein LIO71_02495 [Ruminococcus sp.]|nr:hypothetical protein [Ruminococcus sp.]MCD7801194.1 hypothetical protein [Ruminococcus sp.]